MPLRDFQAAALDVVRSDAGQRSGTARETIDNVLKMSDIAVDNFCDAVESIRRCARVALHFHPDRLDRTSTSVAEAMLADGIYRNQFETYLSNGKLAPYRHGARDLWENQLFGGSYARQGVVPADRPKYGALDLMRLPDGPCPRFGSCFFLLRPEVTSRCTFTYLDSHTDPREKGTIDAFDDILAALLTDSFERDYALGIPAMRPPLLIEYLRRQLRMPFEDPADRPPAKNLNHYIEAQVHGEIHLAQDADILVADPSFQGSPVGSTLEKLCRRYGLALYWHCGYSLHVGEVPTDFRGPTMPSLAERVAGAGCVTARAIGEAAVEAWHDASRWRDRGAPEDVAQELKLLWHVLVRYGQPFAT